MALQLPQRAFRAPERTPGAPERASRALKRASRALERAPPQALARGAYQLDGALWPERPTDPQVGGMAPLPNPPPFATPLQLI